MTTTTITTDNYTHAVNGHITTRDLEESAGTLPVLGFSVQWNLLHVEIAHAGLLGELQSRGFNTVLPQRPSPTTALRRAMVRWLHQRAANGSEPALAASLSLAAEDFEGVEDGYPEELPSNRGAAPGQGQAKGSARARKNLIRKINSPKSDWLVFGLVIEHLDLERLGLSYATRLRVFLHKKSLEVQVSKTANGLEPYPEETDEGGPDQGRAEMAAISTEIRQLFQYYREHHQARDISELLRQVVAGLDSFSMRRLGGVYFVPQQHRPALDSLRDLVENLPATSGHTADKFMLMLPILDGAGARKQLAGAAYRDFIHELGLMQADLDELTSEAETHQVKVRTETVSRRLTAYRELKSRAEIYAELLDMQQEKIQAVVEQLSEQAARLLESLGGASGYPPGEQQIFNWDSLSPASLEEPGPVPSI